MPARQGRNLEPSWVSDVTRSHEGCRCQITRCNGRRHMGSVLKPNQIWSVQEQEKQDEEQDLLVIHKSSTASSTASSKAGQDPRSLFDDPNTDKDLIDQDILSLPLFDAYFNNNMISNSSLAKNRTFSVVGPLTLLARTSNLAKEKIIWIIKNLSLS